MYFIMGRFQALSPNQVMKANAIILYNLNNILLQKNRNPHEIARLVD